MDKKKPTKAALTNEELEVNIKLKTLEAEEKGLNIKDWEERRLKSEEAYIVMSKINTLRNLLECFIPAEDAIPGGEMKLISAFSEEDREVIKMQIMEKVIKL